MAGSAQDVAHADRRDPPAANPAPIPPLGRGPRTDLRRDHGRVADLLPAAVRVGGRERGRLGRARGRRVPGKPGGPADRARPGAAGGLGVTWSPDQYTKFEDDRTRPVRDLLAAVPTDSPARVIDLGCGPGNSTEVLAQRFPGAEIEGSDSSAEMVEAARKR